MNEVGPRLTEVLHEQIAILHERIRIRDAVIAEAVRLLKPLEYEGRDYYDGTPVCPECEWGAGHDADCALGNFLRENGEAK